MSHPKYHPLRKDRESINPPPPFRILPFNLSELTRGTERGFVTLEANGTPPQLLDDKHPLADRRPTKPSLEAYRRGLKQGVQKANGRVGSQSDGNRNAGDAGNAAGKARSGRRPTQQPRPS